MGLQNFLDTYNKIDANNLECLSAIYTENVVFIDPAHEITGLKDLTRYFSSLYQNINTIEFVFTERYSSDQNAFVQWEMKYSHPKLRHGSDIVVPGATALQFTPDGKVHHHRDYFDLGAMLYEHIVVIGPIVRAVKRRLGK